MATVTPFPAATLVPAGVAPAAWTATLDEAYAKAQKAMPDAGERLTRALALVRAGAVEHAAQWGVYRYTVVSESDPTGTHTYDVHAQAPLSCTCTDWTQQTTKGKGLSCTHLLATWLYRRARAQGAPHTPEATTPPQTPHHSAHQAAEVPLPEAAFSLTLKGVLSGAEAMLTIRGQTAEAFKANVAEVRGLLDAPPQPTRGSQPSAPAAAQPTPEGWCMLHGVQMTKQSNARGSWWSHSTREGWCRGKTKGA